MGGSAAPAPAMHRTGARVSRRASSACVAHRPVTLPAQLEQLSFAQLLRFDAQPVLFCAQLLLFTAQLRRARCVACRLGGLRLRLHCGDLRADAVDFRLYTRERVLDVTRGRSPARGVRGARQRSLEKARRSRGLTSAFALRACTPLSARPDTSAAPRRPHASVGSAASVAPGTPAVEQRSEEDTRAALGLQS